MDERNSLDGLSAQHLLELHRATLHELRRRDITRTMNPPQGDLAELLVATAYEGSLAPNSEKSWDVLTSEGRRLQVKAQTTAHDTPRRTLSAIRSLDFDALVVVLLSDADLSVLEAREIPRSTVESHGRRSDHVNALLLTPTPAIMAEGRDVTAQLREAMDSLG